MRIHMSKPGCCLSSSVDDFEPQKSGGRRTKRGRRDDATRNAKTQNFPATQQAPPRQPKMMRFPTAAATRAAAFVATRSTNNPAASSALRFSALRAMSAAAPGPKVRQFSHRPKGGPMQCNCKMMGSIDCFYSFCLQSST